MLQMKKLSGITIELDPFFLQIRKLNREVKWSTNRGRHAPGTQDSGFLCSFSSAMISGLCIQRKSSGIKHSMVQKAIKSDHPLFGRAYPIC